MQTSVVIILLIASIQGIHSKVIRTKARLPAPEHSQLMVFDPLGLIIKWDPVKSGLEKVLGYKVRLWEAQEKTIYSFKNINGRTIPVEETEKPKLADFAVGQGKLMEYVLSGADQTQLALNLKADTPYLIQVLAYGPSGNGEASPDVGVELHGPGSTYLS